MTKIEITIKDQKKHQNIRLELQKVRKDLVHGVVDQVGNHGVSEENAQSVEVDVLLIDPRVMSVEEKVGILGNLNVMHVGVGDNIIGSLSNVRT